MINPLVARRYARALLMIAVEQDILDGLQAELESLLRHLAAEEKVLAVLNNPQVQPQDKKAVLRRLVEGRYSTIVTNFLYLLVDKKREPYLAAIVKEYIKYADEARNIVDAEVRSAVQLTDKDFRELEKRLSRATGKNVRLKTVIDTSLVGGIVVKIGETVMDGSVVKRLALLKNHLQRSQFKGIGGIRQL